MKVTHPTTRRAAFTLIEVMTVIAIIALLAAMGFAGFRYAIRKGKEKETQSRISTIATIIEQYKAEKASYPIPNDSQSTGALRGRQWRVGGAVALYQVLSGDGDDALQGGKGTASTGIPGGGDTTREIRLETCVAPTQQQIQKKQKGQMVDVLDDGRFVVVDGFGRPLQYVVAIRDRNGRITNQEEMHSANNFQIWSYGILEEQDDSPAGQAQWIKSWE